MSQTTRSAGRPPRPEPRTTGTRPQPGGQTGTPAGPGQASGLRELDDPEFFTQWAALRHRIAASGKTVPRDLKDQYAAASDEYRRRVHRY